MKHHAFQALNKKPPGPVGKNATGLIDFHMEGTDQVLTFPLNIYDTAVKCATEIAAGKDSVYPATGQTIHINITPMAVIGFVHFKLCFNRVQLASS